MPTSSSGSQSVRAVLHVSERRYEYVRLPVVPGLPFSLKVLLENLLRHRDDRVVTAADVEAVSAWPTRGRQGREVAFHPTRVLMPDSSGVPLVADLAAMRDAMAAFGDDPERVNPLVPVDLVIDHSVMVDEFGHRDAFPRNLAREYGRNAERYAFLRWGQEAFRGLRVVPPGTGICHQVNLEHLAQVVWTQAETGERVLACPDTVLGMDSHTPMINALGVLGWGVGGIEAGAAMLGQPVVMTIPEVVGCRLIGRLPEGVTATDLVLTVTQRLRARGVVGAFVEFCGPGLDALPVPDRATLANMAPEYGANTGFFPIDRETIRYLAFTGRDPERVALVEAYARAQGLWRDADAPEPLFTDVVEIDLGRVEPCVAGPRRPQDRMPLARAGEAFASARPGPAAGRRVPAEARAAAAGADRRPRDGDVVLAAITSCTNTSNPSVMVAAGLLARKAAARGLRTRPWVKTSIAPGSRVVADYLSASGLQHDLDALGFHVVGFGCTTCMGNSGPLPQPVADAIDAGGIAAVAVLSGNRNFEGRVHPQVRDSFLASPPLVVAYALAGTVCLDLTNEPLGIGGDGRPVYLRDVWPSSREVAEVIERTVSPELFRTRYADIFAGGPEWRSIGGARGTLFPWDPASTYVRRPPFFDGMPREPQPIRDIRDARPLVVLGDSVTTDHISPIGYIPADGEAGRYLAASGVRPVDFNSFGARRANHDVMIRGTFSNARLRNEMAPDTTGGFTRHMPEGRVVTIFEAARRYQAEGVPLVVVAGAEYGAGSSRDWAAKGTFALGVRAVIAESFERIHRSNLVGMGVLPLQLEPGVTRRTLALDGRERFDVLGLAADPRPGARVRGVVHRADGSSEAIGLVCRLDTVQEVEYYRHGGILRYVLRRMMR